jgi:hypothetical protein
VRLRGSLSARSTIPSLIKDLGNIPVASGAPAIFSALSCFSFYNKKTTKQNVIMSSLFFCFLLASLLSLFEMYLPKVLGLPFPCSDDALLVCLLYDVYEIMYDIMYAR